MNLKSVDHLKIFNGNSHTVTKVLCHCIEGLAEWKFNDSPQDRDKVFKMNVVWKVSPEENQSIYDSLILLLG